MKQLDIHSLPKNFLIKDFLLGIDLSEGLEISYLSQFKNAKILRDFIEHIAEQLHFEK